MKFRAIWIIAHRSTLAHACKQTLDVCAHTIGTIAQTNVCWDWGNNDSDTWKNMMD